MINELRHAALLQLDKRASTWRVEKMALDTLVADAHERHEVLVGDYWQAEYRAREKLRSAVQLVAALSEVM